MRNSFFLYPPPKAQFSFIQISKSVLIDAIIPPLPPTPSSPQIKLAEVERVSGAQRSSHPSCLENCCRFLFLIAGWRPTSFARSLLLLESAAPGSIRSLKKSYKRGLHGMGETEGRRRKNAWRINIHFKGFQSISKINFMGGEIGRDHLINLTA